MRKNHLFKLLFLFIAIETSSCNKTWNCECKSSGVVVAVVPIKTLGKMGAKSVCDTYQEENNRNGARQVCVIK